MLPFAPRPTRFLGIERHEGWRVKLYSIALKGDRVDASLFAPGLQLALEALPTPPITAERPGVAFSILHAGRGADYVVLGWWDRENELPLRVFVRGETESEWRPARGSESVCVWDLLVISHERDAYVSTVLADPPLDIEAYLARTLEIP